MKHGDAQRRVSFGRTEITVFVSRRDRRTATVSVYPDLSVVVTAPREESDSAIDRLVRRRAAWIVRQQLRYRDYHPLPVPKKFVSGETHPYLGRQYRLRVVSAGRNHVAVRRPFLVVETTKCGPSEVRDLVERWYHGRANVVLARQFAVALERFPRLRTPNTMLRIARMARRWGSCSSSGTISLNPMLVQVPPGCIEYVIVHELCHRQEMSHGGTFHKLLADVLPDWRERRERLNQCR